MKDCDCPYEKVYAVQFGALREDLQELKTRVAQVETMLGRGVLLLVANLAGVVITLARGLL